MAPTAGLFSNPDPTPAAHKNHSIVAKLGTAKFTYLVALKVAHAVAVL